MHLQRAFALDRGERWALRVRPSPHVKNDGMRLRGACLLAALACLICFCGRGFAAPVRASHLTVELVTEATSIAPNHDFLAGLHFVLDPGWHIYWINAGDAGEPPRVDWHLPAGITAGDLQFPAPERLPLGPLMDFGYQHEVLLPIPMRADASLHPGTNAVLRGQLHFLVCSNVCIPGKAEIEQSCSGHRSAWRKQSRHGAAFPCCGAGIAASIACGHVCTGTANQDGFCHSRNGEERGECEFYPFDQNVIANAAPQGFEPTGEWLAHHRGEGERSATGSGDIAWTPEISRWCVVSIHIAHHDRIPSDTWCP